MPTPHTAPGEFNGAVISEVSELAVSQAGAAFGAHS